MVSVKKTNSRKVHKGPLGGSYIIIKGQKKYIGPKKPSASKMTKK